MARSPRSVTTLAWYRIRMHAAHRTVLQALATGAEIDWPMGLRGSSQEHRRRAIVNTLERWGAINDGRITEIGRRLIG